MQIQDVDQRQGAEDETGPGDLEEIVERRETEAPYRNGELVAATTEALQLFLNEISRERLLTREEEAALARRIERGDRRARERMIRSNLALVVSVAKRYRTSELSLLDLIQEGVIGLMQAVDRFDWRRGHKFSTYAIWWIRNGVQRAIANKERTIRIPIGLGDRKRRIAAAERDLVMRLGRTALEHEVAQEARLTAQQVREAYEAPRKVVSLDQPVSAQDGTPLGEFVPDQRLEPAEEVVISMHEVDLRKALRGAVSRLPERERCIVELRYGLDGGEPTTLAELGRRLGLTRERIRQIEMEALKRLAGERELQALYAAV